MYTPRENHFLRDGEASVLAPQAIAQLTVMMTEYGGRRMGWWQLQTTNCDARGYHSNDVAFFFY
jgi:hypothetical protein